MSILAPIRDLINYKSRSDIDRRAALDDLAKAKSGTRIVWLYRMTIGVAILDANVLYPAALRLLDAS